MGEVSSRLTQGNHRPAALFTRMAILLLMGLQPLHAYAVDFTYSADVLDGSLALIVLVPINSTLAGPIGLNTTPGGNTTSTADFLTADLIITSSFTGTSSICFFYNINCGPTDGTPAEILSIDNISVDFAPNGCPYSGIMNVTAFSPTLNLNIPVSLNLTDGTFMASAATAGFVSGTGSFNCTAVADIDTPNDNPASVINFGAGVIGQPPALASKSITVSSFGGGVLNVGTLTLTGASDFTITANTCSSASLAPTQECSVTIGFTPTTVGTRTAALTIPSNDLDENPVVFNFTAAVSPAPGQISAATTLAIADTEVGAMGSADLIVTNTGLGSLGFGLIATTNPLAAPFSIANDGCSFMTLAPSMTCTISVQFAPSVEGAFMDSFEIPSNDPVTGELTINVSATAVPPPAPILGAAPDPLNLPMAMISESSTGVLTVSNTGNADLDVDALNLPMGPFSVLSDTCIGNAVPAAGFCTVTVEFTPVSVGAQSAILSIVSNDAGSPEGVTVNAEGTAQLIADIDAMPAALTFAPLLIGQSASQTVTISSMGNTDLLLSGSSITPAGNYTLVDNCPATLAMGLTCTIDVTFAPLAAGALNAVLNVVSNDPDENPLAITLSGVGVQPAPEIDVSTTSLDLGSPVVGTSSTGIVTVSNTGTANLMIFSLMIDMPFTEMSNCVGALAPAATCTVTVTYTPPIDAPAAGDLTIFSDDADEAMLVVSLSGIGTLLPTPSIVTTPTATTGVNFGTVLVGASPMQTITVTSNGSADLDISAVTIMGVDAAEFARVTTCVGTVIIGATCAIDVTFSPALPAVAKVASVMISSDDPNRPVVTIPLAGVSEAPVANASFSTTTVMFPSVDAGQASQASITVTNVGNGDLVVSAVGGTDPIDLPFSLLNQTCTGAPIAPMATCVIDLTFMSAVDGSFSDSFTFESNSVTPSTTLSLAGSATPIPTSMILLDVTNLDFGNVVVGTPQTAVVTVTNNGNADLSVDAVDIAPTGEFSVVSNCVALMPSASCTIDVTYLPTAPGAAVAALTITSNDPASPVSTVGLNGIGVMPEPEISVLPLTLNLGALVVGNSTTANVTVTNEGLAALTVSGVTLTGPNAVAFTQTNNCAMVIIGGNCTVAVTYSPVNAGAATATLSIASDDADESVVNVALSGMAMAMPVPIISAPASADAGDVVAGESGTLPLVIQNTGSVNLVISNLVFSGPNAAAFSSSNDCATIVAMGSCTLPVIFAPASEGAATATLEISSNDTTNPVVSVAVSGNGIAAPAGMAVLDLSSVDFSDVFVGDSASTTVTVTNNGTANLVISDATITEVVGGNYSLVNNCSIVIVGQSCTINVSFVAPNTPMNSSAKLTIFTNDPNAATVLINLIAKAVPLEEVIVRVQGSGGSGSFGLLDFSALLAMLGLIRRRGIAAALLAFVTLAVALPAQADENKSPAPVEGYWYGGGGGGSSSGNSDNAAIISGIEAAGVTVSSLSVDDSDSGWKAFVGYQATESIALEVGYADLGNAGINLQLGATTVGQLPLISRAVSGNTALLGGGYFGSVVLKHRFENNFAVLGRVGLLSWEVDSIITGSNTSGAINIAEQESGTDFLFGVGAEYWFADVPLGIRAEWERYSFGDDDAQLITLSGVFRF